MKLSKRQTKRLIGPLSGLLGLLAPTLRVRRQGFPFERTEPQFIDALCHGQMLFFLLLHRVRGRGCVTLISEHRDGQLIAEVIERWGGQTTRGSSTRGGVRAYLELLREHRDQGWVVTPDGPRGPRGSVHEGVIKLASDSNRGIRPHGYAVSMAKYLNSWDRFTFPLPFARVVEFVGDPLHVPPKVDKQTRRELAKDLERRLAEASMQAEIALAKWLRRPAKPVSEGEHDAPTST